MLRAVAIVALLVLSACNSPAPAPDGGGGRGRYVGVGVFPASDLWREMIVKAPNAGKASATTRDDSHIIVVVDSHSGDIRECGEMSGRCVSMNPWTAAIAKEQVTPVSLSKHGADLSEVTITGEANVSGDERESAKAK